MHMAVRAYGRASPPVRARRNRGSGAPDDTRNRCQAVGGNSHPGRDDKGRGIVVHAGGVARRHAATKPKRGREGAQFLKRGRARVFINLDLEVRSLALRNEDRRDFQRHSARCLRGSGLVLAAMCKIVLIRARNASVFGRVLGCLGHGFDPVLRPHRRQGTAIASDWGAGVGTDKRVAHASPPWSAAVGALSARKTSNSSAVGGGVSDTVSA